MSSGRYRLSVIVITFNEERNISACLQSVSWAGEIILVDSQSNDQTVSIARQYTDRIFIREWAGYGSAKSFALEQANNEWILWVDADERVTQELAEEIQEILMLQASEHSGYEVGRRAYFLGKWIKHCGWYPGYVVRLFRKKSAKFSASNVHEKVEVQGLIGTLRNDLLHFTDDNLFHYVWKLNRYTSLAVEDMIRSNRTVSLYDLIVRPPFIFMKMYVLRFGFLDGMHGLALSLLSASYVFVKYAKTWEHQNAR